MGSFATTCAVSGLPIEAGDKVMFFLLGKKSHTDLHCYMHDEWVPRTFPLAGEYNDYGSVENLEEGYMLQNWFDGFKEDLIEIGVGDNSCHDVAIRKNMNLEQLLEALWENRVKVDSGSSWGGSGTKEERAARWKKIKEEFPDPPPPAGVPTFLSVEAVLRAAGYALPGDKREQRAPFSLLVDEKYPGCVRVRIASLPAEEWRQDAKYLAQVQECLTDYAVVMTAGSGSYSHIAELLVMVKPNTKREDGYPYHYSELQPWQRDSEQLIQQAMIRQDVWDALLKIPVETYRSGRKTLTVDDFRKEVAKYWELAIAAHRSTDRFALMEFNSNYGMDEGKENVAASFFRCTHMSGFNIQNSFRNMTEKFADDPGSGTPIDFLNRVAEFLYIWDVLAMVRYWWRPSYTCGPQFGEWGLHEAFLKALQSVVADKAEETRQEREESDAWYAAYEAEEAAKKTKKLAKAKKPKKISAKKVPAKKAAKKPVTV